MLPSVFRRVVKVEISFGDCPAAGGGGGGGGMGARPAVQNGVKLLTYDAKRYPLQKTLLECHAQEGQWVPWVPLERLASVCLMSAQSFAIGGNRLARPLVLG